MGQDSSIWTVGIVFYRRHQAQDAVGCILQEARTYPVAVSLGKISLCGPMTASLKNFPLIILPLCLFLSGLLLVVMLVSYPVGECAAPSETLHLADPAFSQRQRPGVLFTHGEHMARTECTDCHHVFADGKNTWEYGMETSCSACHKAGDRGPLGLRRAWHGQCLGCHEEQKGVAGRAPVMCGECHVRGSGTDGP